jgi:hypothetical protein
MVNEPQSCTPNNTADDMGWAFEEGQWVTHKDQPMPSLVMMRVRSRRGAEIYGVRSFAFTDVQRDRIILGECLRPIDDAAREICLLSGTGMADW